MASSNLLVLECTLCTCTGTGTGVVDDGDKDLVQGCALGQRRSIKVQRKLMQWMRGRGRAEDANQKKETSEVHETRLCFVLFCICSNTHTKSP